MSRVIAKVRRARYSAGITFKMPKMFVPVDCQVPTTAKQLVARQLYQAGLISKTDFEQMLGVLSAGEYDGDYDINNEEFDDEAFQSQPTDFEQSDFADYEDLEDYPPEPPVGNVSGRSESDLSVPRDESSSVPDSPQTAKDPVQS